MKEKRNSGAMGFAAVVILLLVPMTAYVAGYFLRCDVLPVVVPSDYWSYNGGAYILFRVYPTEFEAQLFQPAARIESTLTRREVNVSAEPALSIIVD